MKGATVLLLALTVACSGIGANEIRSKTFVRNGFPASYKFGDFEKLGDKYYLINHSAQVSWHKAVEACYKLNGHLATLSDEDERKSLSSRLRSHISETYWLAGSDLGSRDSFYWATTGARVSIDTQKEEGGSCLKFIFNDGVIGNLVASECTDKTHYICELQKAKTVEVMLY